MYIILTSQKQLEKDTVREVLYSKSKVNANVLLLFQFYQNSHDFYPLMDVLCCLKDYLYLNLILTLREEL